MGRLFGKVLVTSIWKASEKMLEELLEEVFKEVRVKTPLVSSGDFHVDFHS